MANKLEVATVLFGGLAWRVAMHLQLTVNFTFYLFILQIALRCG